MLGDGRPEVRDVSLVTDTRPTGGAYRSEPSVDAVWACSDCGDMRGMAGECDRCPGGPRVDTSREEIRSWLVDEDQRRRTTREQSLLWIAIITIVALVFGGLAFGRAENFAYVLSIQGIVVMIALSLGGWRLLIMFAPSKDRFPQLRR